MNTIVTSKKEILQISRDLIQTKGWNALNIRALAKECNISVGSIYNYFHNKSDLITATVESIWNDIFHFSDQTLSFETIIDCVEWAFDCLKKGEETYPGFFAFHSMLFLEENKTHGVERMNEAWKHMSSHFHHVLLHDPKVDPDTFDDVFTPQKFVELIFSLIMAAIIRHDYDCSGIIGMIQRTVYK